MNGFKKIINQKTVKNFIMEEQNYICFHILEIIR